jgi:hypothetical protein
MKKTYEEINSLYFGTFDSLNRIVHADSAVVGQGQTLITNNYTILMISIK